MIANVCHLGKRREIAYIKPVTEEFKTAEHTVFVKMKYFE